MKNLSVVFFIPSINISRAHARIHKVFYPCNRCHLATLLENQVFTCGNEVTRVTTNGDFAHRFIQHRGTEAQSFYYFSVSQCSPKYSMWVAQISQFSIPPYGTNRKMSSSVKRVSMTAVAPLVSPLVSQTKNLACSTGQTVKVFSCSLSLLLQEAMEKAASIIKAILQSFIVFISITYLSRFILI